MKKIKLEVVEGYAKEMFLRILQADAKLDSEVCTQLIDSLTTLNFKNSSGYTPLHLAAMRGNRDLCEQMVVAQAKKTFGNEVALERFLNETDSIGRNAIVWGVYPPPGIGRSGATQKEVLSAIAYLVDAGVSLKTIDRNGRTPIHWMVDIFNQDDESVELLQCVAGRSSLDVRDNVGVTAFEIAKERCKFRFANAIANCGTDLALDTSGNAIPDIGETIQKMKDEIMHDVRSGKIPADVQSFGDLHDHVDANEYGGFCVDEFADALISHFGGRDHNEGMPDGMMDYLNDAQTAVSEWITAGGIAEALNAGSPAPK